MRGPKIALLGCPPTLGAKEKKESEAAQRERAGKNNAVFRHHCPKKEEGKSRYSHRGWEGGERKGDEALSRETPEQKKKES